MQINDFKVGLFHKACQEESDELYENVIFKCLHDTLVTRQVKIFKFQKLSGVSLNVDIFLKLSIKRHDYDR